MTTKEKQKFIRDLTKSVVCGIIEKCDKMPNEWDGHELRRLIADKFANETTSMPPARIRSFRNECLTRNL